MNTVAEHAADFALGFMDFSHVAGGYYVHKTSRDGASYMVIAPRSDDALNLTLETPVRVVTVIDGESLGSDEFTTLRGALIDLYGASEGEKLPAIFGSR
tara:strand:+ start:209 stop:505 length:297 start_codon:yes stop_codon:yes gene_type:complete